MTHIAQHEDMGIFAWFGIPLPFRERMKLIRESGFTSTSIWWEERDPVRRRLRHLAPALVREAGLRLDNIHVPYRGVNDLWSEEASLRDAAVQQHLEWITACARHEVPKLVMHVVQGNGPAAHVPWQAGLESFGTLLQHAEKAGVQLALENTRCPEYLDFLFTRFDSPAMGLCYDISHDWLHSPEPFRLLRDWSHRLLVTHLSDTDGILDRHWIPGTGCIPFEQIPDVLLETTFSGTHMLEVTATNSALSAPDFLAAAWQHRMHALGKT
jgi:sugar phosphate isomerase/epimerase